MGRLNIPGLIFFLASLIKHFALKMKSSFFLVLIFLFVTGKATYGQSGSFVVGIDHFQKTNQFFHYLLSDKSLGFKLGYSQSFDKEAWNIDFTGFANYLDYNFDLSTDKYFTGGTLFSGIGIMPWYCLNPYQKLRVSVGTLVKGQFGFGQGDIFKRQPEEGTDERLEKKFIKSSFGFGFSPQLMIAYPVQLGTVGIEAGWDSSDVGKCVNLLRSSYYKPINYHSSSFFLGLVFRIRL